MKLTRLLALALLCLTPLAGHAQNCVLSGSTPLLAGTQVICLTGSAGAAGISAVWANDGGDKVTQDEIRATTSSTSVLNPAWDGTTIRQFGAKNEVVSFNVILEAGSLSSPTVAVALSNLTNGASTIRTNQARSTSGNGLFNWTTTETELFYVRYLQIRGLSIQAFGGLTGNSFEPWVPFKERLPLVGGSYTGLYVNRPNANKYYPDAAVPLELVPTFAVTAPSNQQVWVDIYIPKTALAGTYTGTLTVSESGSPTHVVPVSLTVRNFTLPDVPTMGGLVDSNYGDVTQRYTGVQFPVVGSANDLIGNQVLANQRYMAHRHKLAMIGDDPAFSNASPTYPTNPSTAYQPFVTGSAFTSGNGYAGPGVSTGQGVYSIGTYGSWKNYTGWTAMTQTQFNTNTNAWETWFEANAPSSERFVYLADESSNYPLVQQWAHWMATNPGVGVNLKSFATIGAVSRINNWSSATAYVVNNVVLSGSTLYVCILANTNQAPPNATYWSVYSPTSTGPQAAVSLLEPDVHIVTSTWNAGNDANWQASVNALRGTANYEYWMYNGARPGVGTTHEEEDGTDLRARSWTGYKKGAKWWFEWEATYYNDNQCGSGQSNLFVESRTFCHGTGDTLKGLYGNNGDGMLFYPGTDAVFPSSSYALQGPIASLRLKHWRRGVQDVDYAALALPINPGTTSALEQNLVPSVLWENQVPDPSDPSYYVGTPVSWSSDPVIWESARAQLANVIDGTGLTISPVSVPAAVVGIAYTQTLTVANSTNLISWKILSGPSWLSIASTGTTTAHITGTPTAGNLTQVAIQATDTVTGATGPVVLYLNNQLTFPLLGGMYIAGSVQTSWGTSAFQKQVARLGVAVIGTYPGWTSGGFNMQSAAAAVKAINPSIKLVPYTNLMELEPGVGSSGSAYSPIFNAATFNNWFLRTAWPAGSITDADGNAQNGLNETTLTVAGTGAYAAYANYLAWRAAWTTANEYPGSFWDGVYLDNVFSAPRVSADYNQSGSSQTASAATANWQAGYVAYAAPGGYLRKALPVGKLVFGNSADWANHSVTSYSGMLDSGVIEGITTYQTTWATQMAAYKATMLQMRNPSYAIYAQDGSVTNYQFMRYGLCQALLDNAYYYHSNNGSYDTVEWFDEFNFKLGTPIAGPGNASNGTWSSGGITVWKAQGPIGVFRRDFTNGIVIENPAGNGVQTFVVDASLNYYHLKGTQASPPNDGTQVAAGSTVTLQDADGLILSRTHM